MTAIADPIEPINFDLPVAEPQSTEEWLKSVLAEPNTTIKIFKITNTGYRVNWYKRGDGYGSVQIHKSAFLYCTGTDGYQKITYPDKQ